MMLVKFYFIYNIIKICHKLLLNTASRQDTAHDHTNQMGDFFQPHAFWQGTTPRPQPTWQGGPRTLVWGATGSCSLDIRPKQPKVAPYWSDFPDSLGNLTKPKVIPKYCIFIRKNKKRGYLPLRRSSWALLFGKGHMCQNQNSKLL